MPRPARTSCRGGHSPSVRMSWLQMSPLPSTTLHHPRLPRPPTLCYARLQVPASPRAPPALAPPQSTPPTVAAQRVVAVSAPRLASPAHRRRSLRPRGSSPCVARVPPLLIAGASCVHPLLLPCMGIECGVFPSSESSRVHPVSGRLALPVSPICRLRRLVVPTEARGRDVFSERHEATDTKLLNAPVPQATGHSS